MDLEAALERLRSAPYDDFVKVRKALVRQLRDEGEPHLARRMATERKPNRATWVVQHIDSSLLREVENARDDARRAQEKKSGAELRESLDRYRQAVSRAVDDALQKLPHVNATYERAIRALLERHGSDPFEDLPTKRPRKKKERVPKPKKPKPTKEEKRLAALLKKQERLRAEIEALRSPRG